MAQLKRTSVDLDEDLWRRARVRAFEEGIAFRDLLTRALEQYLKSKPKKGGRDA